MSMFRCHSMRRPYGVLVQIKVEGVGTRDR